MTNVCDRRRMKGGKERKRRYRQVDIAEKEKKRGGGLPGVLFGEIF